MHQNSVGILRYFENPLKIIVEVDPEIAEFYRSLIPKWIKVNRPRYPPHISVVRNEQPPDVRLWRRHEGFNILFQYDPYIHVGRVYCWLNVYSKCLEYTRRELGLPVSSEITRPPEGHDRVFHMTIANQK